MSIVFVFLCVNLSVFLEVDDTKGFIRISILKKNRQRNGQKTKDKQPSRSRRYQRGNQNPYIEKEQTTQWLKENKQTTIYQTYKTKD
jgi:predicted RNA-binding protein with RPS1 domain